MQTGASARMGAFRAVSGDRRLRRLQLADAGSMLGSWGYVVALGVFAFGAGGAALVGAATVARILPQAVSAPLAGALVRRWGRRGTMLRCDLAGAVLLLAAAAAIAAGAPPAVVLAVVACKAAVGAWFRPAKAALVPALARRPEDLTAMNVVSGLVENVGMFGGPALGGLLLVVSSPEVVFAVAALTLVWSALLVRAIDQRDERERVPLRVGALVAEVRDAGRAIAESGPLRVVMGLLALQTLVAGGLSVFIVVVALEALDRGPEWVGYLEGATGVGGVVGALLATSLVGRARISGAFGAAMALWGAPVAVLAVAGRPEVALGALVVLGAANSLGDVSYLTMLQRALPEAQIARVFGGLDALAYGTMAIGGVVCAQAVERFGLTAALLAFGALLPVAVAVLWVPLRRIDAAPPSPRVLALLRSLPAFSTLPASALERLAFAAAPVSVPAGAVVFEQGEAGDRGYLVDAGRAEVIVDGAAVRVQEPGSYFGEIALLHDVPRTATVRALEPLELWTLERDDFLAAVGASPETEAGVARVAAARLRYARPATAG